MSKSLFSGSWYRVAEIKPRLRSNAKIHRQQFRGQVWYVLQDQASGRFHRFSPAANLVIGLMDGKRTVQEIWDTACTRLEEDILTQDETIQLLAKLHMSEVLQGDVPPDLAEMSERASSQRRRKMVFSLLNPMAVRVPVLDPERFLRATFPLVKPIFTWVGLLFLLSFLALGIVVASMHWSELTENITERVFVTESIIYLLITYPFVKALHELGHSYAVKNWGGEVHEMGLMFLVFIPVPYVDASAAAAFPEKWRRALVGGAGILVELVLATIALFVWLDAEPGLVRTLAFNVMLIGGISTLLFNGNPLLRFDGYYVLADLVEIPNLGQRSNKYLFYLAQRYLFGAEDAVSPVTSPGEKKWFVGYAVSAFCYRILIMVVIISFVATKFFIVGVLLAIWAVCLMYGLPLVKGIWFVLTSPVLHRCRARAVTTSVGILTAVVLAGLVVPVPYGTVSEGVLSPPGEAVVHARTEGFVAEILAPPGSEVEVGTPLIRLEDPLLSGRVRVLQAETRELERRLDLATVADRAEAKIVRERLRHARAELSLNENRFEDLVVRSTAGGKFVLPAAADLAGKYVNKGDTLAYVSNFERPVARVVVSQDVIDLVRRRTQDIQVRLINDLWTVVKAEKNFEIPAATDRLPSVALSTEGGGSIVMDPAAREYPKTLRKIFELELKLVDAVGVKSIGSRVYVRFDHGSEALIWRLYRNVRQIFLSKFNV